MKKKQKRETCEAVIPIKQEGQKSHTDTSLVMKFFRALGKQRLAVLVELDWDHNISMKSIGTPELTQIYSSTWIDRVPFQFVQETANNYILYRIQTKCAYVSMPSMLSVRRSHIWLDDNWFWEARKVSLSVGSCGCCWFTPGSWWEVATGC